MAMLVPLICRNLMQLPPNIFATLRNPLIQFQSLLEDFIAKNGGPISRLVSKVNPVRRFTEGVMGLSVDI